jgi:methyl-accepting chemotaxis protein WspA
MDKFNEQVRQGAEEIRGVGAQLAGIIEQVHTLTPSFESVDEGMQAQSQGAANDMQGEIAHLKLS